VSAGTRAADHVGRGGLSDDQDPLAGAAVGETRTFEHEAELDTVIALPEHCFGSDRDFDVEIAAVDIVEADHPDDPPNVSVTYEVEATKWLPRRWDQCDEPRTDAEARRDRVRTWASRIVSAASILFAFVIGTVVTNAVMRRFATEVTINGQTTAPPTLLDTASSLAIVFMLGIAMMALLKRTAGISGGQA